MTKQLTLEIELVPASSWYDNVRAILTKSQWDKVRTSVYAKAWYLCEICGGTGSKHPVECHEVWIYDDKKCTQTLDRMISLCPNCHQVKHFGLATIQGKDEKAFAHFMKINKLAKKDARAYIKKAFDTWAERSKKTWTVDVSKLKDYGIDISKLKVK